MLFRTACSKISDDNMSTGFTSTDRASLKRALEITDEVRADVKRIVSLLEELTDKNDALNENVEQIGRGLVECLAQVEDVGSQLTILKASSAAAGRAAPGAGSGAGLSFEEFLIAAVKSQSNKGALVKAALTQSFCLSSDKVLLARFMYAEYQKKSGADQDALTGVGAGAAATWDSVGSVAVSIATKRGEVKKEGTCHCAFFAPQAPF